MKRRIAWLASILAFLSVCGPGILPLAAQEFAGPFDIRARAGIPEDFPFSIAYQGRNIYVGWIARDAISTGRRDYKLKLVASTDGGASFGEPVILASTLFARIELSSVVVGGDEVYVAFSQGSPSPYDIFVCRLSRKERPCRFVADTTKTGRLLGDLRLAAADNRVYLVWNDQVFGGDVHLVYSDDYGETFSQPLNLTNDPDRTVRRQVSDLTVSGGEIYIRWTVNNQAFLLHGSTLEEGIESSETFARPANAYDR